MDYEKKDRQENRFAFGSSDPLSFPGGTLHRATKKKFPALQGLAIQALHLNPRAVREPHVHPNAHQLDYCVSGKARVGIIGPEGHRQLLDLGPGDISFVPQGYAHWIENVGDGPLHFLVILSHEEPETIETSEIIGGVPKPTLASALGLAEDLVNQLHGKTVTIGDGSIL